MASNRNMEIIGKGRSHVANPFAKRKQWNERQFPKEADEE
jgi:hypothetical protein